MQVIIVIFVHWLLLGVPGSMYPSNHCCGAGSGIPSESGSGSKVLVTKNWRKKYSWKKNNLFWSKIAIYILALRKGHPSFRRSLQLSKENIQHFKKWNLLTFLYFCGSFLPSLIRIQGSHWIRIHNTASNLNQPVQSMRVRIGNTVREDLISEHFL